MRGTRHPPEPASPQVQGSFPHALQTVSPLPQPQDGFPPQRPHWQGVLAGACPHCAQALHAGVPSPVQPLEHPWLHPQRRLQVGHLLLEREEQRPFISIRLRYLVSGRGSTVSLCKVDARVHHWAKESAKA